MDALEVITRYLPAVRDGRVALAVDDILGDGAPAAAVMGQLRSSLDRRATAATPRRAAPLDALVDGLLADLVDVASAADAIAVAAVRSRPSRR